MLDCGANVPVISQTVAEKHQVPGVLRRQACGFSTFDGSESDSAGRACALVCTLRTAGHCRKDTFEISLRHPKFMITGAQTDLRFDDPRCINCTAEAVSEFIVEYDDSMAYVGNEQKWVGVLGSLRFSDESHVELDIS